MGWVNAGRAMPRSVNSRAMNGQSWSGEAGRRDHQPSKGLLYSWLSR